jgi:hypothetical protein
MLSVLDGCSEKVFRVTRAKLIRILGGKKATIRQGSSPDNGRRSSIAE